MATIIQNINTLMTVKSQLNAILGRYGIDGGDDFSSYPEKFEELISYLEQNTQSEQ